MNSYIINFCTNLIDVSLLYYYLNKTTGYHGPNRHERSSVVTVVLSLVVANTLINQFLGIASLPGFGLMLLCASLGFCYLFKKHIFYIFLVLLFGLGVMFLLELVAFNLVVFLFRLPPAFMFHLNGFKVLGIFLSKGSFLVIVRYWLYKFPILHKYQAENRPIVLILFFNIVIIYTAFMISQYMGMNEVIYYMILFLLLLSALFVSWAVYVLTKRMIVRQQEEEVLNLKLREYENQRLYLHSMEDMILNIRAQRHDLNNYIGVLYGMIDLGQYEKAKNYMMKLESNLSSVNQIIDANHPVLTALLSVKYQKAVREKIKMYFQIDIPEELGIDSIDVSIILGNILDNAIEACIQADLPEPFIQMEMYVKENNLIIKLKNSKNVKVEFDASAIVQGYTTKEEKEGHGFGLTNIKRVVEQNNGVLKLQDLGNQFETYIALPVKEDVS